MFLTFKLYLPNDWHSFHLLWRYTVRLKVEAGTPYKKNIHINNLTYMVDACITLDQNAWIYLKICSIKQQFSKINIYFAFVIHTVWITKLLYTAVKQLHLYQCHKISINYLLLSSAWFDDIIFNCSDSNWKISRNLK